MNVLISGAGIAGLTLAFWLERFGHQVTLIEKCGNIIDRKGYMIDFWGPGVDVAEKMGLIKTLEEKAHDIDQLLYVNKNGKPVSHLNVRAMRELLNNRVYSLLRGDLEKALLESISDKVSIQFNTHITDILSAKDNVTVTFNNGNQSTFDLVVGADGIHSKVRELTFGEEKQFSRYLGYRLGACIQPNTMNIKNKFYIYSEPEKQAAIYPIQNNQVATFFIYKAPNAENLDNPKEHLIDTFKHATWIVPEVLNSVTQANETFLDTLTQIEMPSWHKDRVVLVGDACQCLTLMAGQGASMAMAGAYVLAYKLQQYSSNLEKAFKEYENFLKPSIIAKQKEARRFIRSFVPNTQFGIFCRNLVTRFLTLPFVGKLLFKNLLGEKLVLPDERFLETRRIIPMAE